MSDRTSDSGLTVWIALRRAHEGGVANLAGRWLDSGRRVPGYVADARDGLTSAGLLALGEVDFGRPPVEQFPRPIPAPGGRLDTTTLVDLRRGSPGAGQVVINPRVQLPLVSADAAARALQEYFLANADRGGPRRQRRARRRAGAPDPRPAGLW